MMKLNRFSLVAGLLALGVAACGDDVEVVQPAPPQPPPPPPLSATMAPASAEVEVGSSVVFAVSASGGVVGEAASWSCASSNTGIATVSVTSAGCQATGVAAGGVTITASVSKSGETANVGAQLTVTSPPAPPPFEASIAPESQSVAVGSSVVFAVNTSGGYTGMMMGDMMMAASWTCSSSDPAIATVETTDAGCQATGVSGGEVTINVAATDDHATINLVAQLTVTTDPVDPVQPFSASMAPESATVTVGSDAVFAINTSGGAADATAEWICSSSDDAIATATTTDAGCQATGVAAGGVTINAAVTKGEDSANLASQLTVTAPDVAEPAFVFITKPTDGNSVNGTVSVDVSIERGDQVPAGLSLLVDGDVVAHQSFGMAATPAMDEPAEQAPGITFTLSFDSGEYDAETGAVTYPNGEHVISAQLTVVGGAAPVSSNSVAVEFDNPNKVMASVSGLGEGAMNSSTGQIWYGGPDASVEITAVPVVYSSGGSVASLTLKEFCDADAATDSEAPFVFTPDCAKASYTTMKDEGDKPEFTVAGTKIAASGKALYLDFGGPAAPHFEAYPNDRQDGWLNAAVDFLGEQKSSNKDGWLHYIDDDESGVGGYMPQLRWSTTTPSIVDGARAATPNALPTEATNKDAACVIATAVDLLGNESKLPSAGTACASAAAYATTTGTGDDAETTYAAGIRAGLDLTPPTIKFTGASPGGISPKTPVRSLNEFQMQVADSEKDASGIHTEMPALALLEIRGIDNKVTCGKVDDTLPGNKKLTGECVSDGEGLAYSGAVVRTTGVMSKGTVGYYTFTAQAQDKAGNKSAEISRVALRDDSRDASGGVIVGTFNDKKSSVDLTVTLTDDLSVRDYYVSLNFDAAPTGTTPTRFRLMNPVAVDAYNSATLTQKTADPSGSFNAFRAIQATAAGATEDNVEDFGTTNLLVGAAVHVRDQADSDFTPSADASAGVLPADFTADLVAEFAAGAPDAEAGIGKAAHFTAKVDEDDATYDVSDEDTIELTAKVSGYARDAKPAIEDDTETTGTDETRSAVDAIDFEQPFLRVDFYASNDSNGDTGNSDAATELRFITSVSGISASAEHALENTTGDDELPTIAQRADADTEITWTYAVEVSAADFYTAVAGDGAYTAGDLIAVGVYEEGVGLTSQPVEITITK